MYEHENVGDPWIRHALTALQTTVFQASHATNQRIEDMARSVRIEIDMVRREMGERIRGVDEQVREVRKEIKRRKAAPRNPLLQIGVMATLAVLSLVINMSGEVKGALVKMITRL